MAAGIGRNNARSIRVLPVPMRVDSAEKLRVDTRRQVARQRFIGLPTGMPESGGDRYWATVEVPYHAFYPFEETLATFGDQPSVPSSHVTLARYVTNGAVSEFTPMDENLRSRTLELFAQRVAWPEEKVILRYMTVPPRGQADHFRVRSSPSFAAAHARDRDRDRDRAANPLRRMKRAEWLCFRRGMLDGDFDEHCANWLL